MADDKLASNPPKGPRTYVGGAAKPGNSSKFHNGILVLGMHRSGTSAVAGLLGHAGAYLGEKSDLLPAHAHDNPAGYWERDDVVAAHDATLDAHGFKWDRIADLDPRSFDPDSIHVLQVQLREIIGRLSRSGAPWLVKDPRLCLLLPQWLSLVENPGCVVVVRDPREIAASMCDGPRGAYTSHFVVALWEKYLRIALEALRGKPALFVDYLALIDSPEVQCRRIVSGLESLGISGLHLPTSSTLAGFLDSQLRRSKAKPHVRLSTAQQALFDWLLGRCAAMQPQAVTDAPDADLPNETLHEFERVQAGQSELIARLDAAIHDHESAVSERDAAVHERNTAALRGAEAIHQRELAFSERDAAVHERNTAALRSAEAIHQRELAFSERDAAVHERDTAIGEHSVAVAQLTQVRRDIQSAATRINELNAGIDKAERRATSVAVELDRTRHERNIAAGQRIEAERQARELDGSIRELRASWSWKLTRPLRALADLFALRVSANLEQGLYRTYYAMPGASPARKRAFILWLHSRASWLTHNTLSYRLARQTPAAPVTDPGAIVAARMDQASADAITAELKHKPLVSVIMPVYNVERRWLLAAVDSVRRQFYPHWQLCIADDASTRKETQEALREIESWKDKRISITRQPHNTGIAAASNAALKLAKGEYVGLLDNDDELTRDALLEVVRCINDAGPDIIYSDEDKLDETGAHVEVHCKPDYSPDYFFSINYLCHFAVIRRDLLDKIGGFRAGFDGAQDYDLLLRATEHTDKIAHVAKVLYHWRRIPGSTASTSAAKPQTSDAGRRAIAESMTRRGIDCTVEAGPYPNTFRVHRAIAGNPLVNILLPFRDKPDLLKTCVNSILEKTRYPHYEILCVDNGSVEPETHDLLETLKRRDGRVRAIRHDVPFNFSAINNFAATQATGEHLLFLNNDTEVISAEWLDAMLEHSQRKDVGVVGARLWYADGTIQHAGVIIGPGGVAGHGHLFTPGDDPGYFARIRLVQDLSAVTFACAMTRREVFQKLGGLNERDLRIAFNDVDYCLRAREAGYLVVYTPYALLHHYESKSRGYEDTPEKQTRFGAEIRYMQERHRAILEKGDPYYNPDLSLANSFQPDPAYAAQLPR